MNLALFDLDGTLIRGNSSFAFIRFLTKKGLLSTQDLLFCSRHYLYHRFFSLSLLKLHQNISRRLFCGRSLIDLNPFVHAFIEEKLANMWYVPALHRLQLFQKQGVSIMIISNSPTFLVQPIASKMGVDRAYGTDYNLDKSGYLGDIASLIDGKKKGEILKKEATKLESVKTYAFSDSLLDLPFLEAATITVVVNPRFALKRLAKRRHWEIL